MKKNIILNFTRIILGLFLVASIMAIFIAYREIDNNLASNFMKGYVVLLVFVLIYVPIITIINLRKLKSTEIKKKIIKFIVTVVIITCANCIFDYFFKSSKIDILRAFKESLGLAFGINFVDIIIFKIKGKSNGTAW